MESAKCVGPAGNGVLAVQNPQVKSMVERRKADRHIASVAGIELVAVLINFADPAERYLIGIAQVNFIIILPHA